MTNRIAEFQESDDALRFAHLKGPDFTVCGGVHMMWAVRPKSRREVGLGDPFEPAESVVDEHEDYDDE